MNGFAFNWPWLGLALATVMLVMLFGTDFLRSDRSRRRIDDLGWLAWAALPLYMLHQVEEHGIDAFGHVYAFLPGLCQTFGFAPGSPCPIPTSFITAVNVGTVWGACLIAGFASRKHPLLGLSAYAIPLVNAVLHIRQALVSHSYNPGLLSAVLLFLPVCFQVIRQAMTQGVLSRRGLFLLVLAGALLHGVLMGSVLLFLRGRIETPLLDLIQILNIFVPVLVMLLAAKPRTPSGSNSQSVPGT